MGPYPTFDNNSGIISTVERKAHRYPAQRQADALPFCCLLHNHRGSVD